MAKLTKEEKKARRIEKKKNGLGLWAEFKSFLNKGNAFMLAVGVVIGGAFTAIVNSLTNILLNLVAAAVPGGISGLVTPLKTVTAIGLAENAGISADRMVLSASEWQAIESVATRGLYTAHGGRYYFSSMPILDWGTFINAIISFLLVGAVLFLLVKLFAIAAKKKADIEAKAREAYYQRHPEMRPAEPEPEAPKPTQEELLGAILAELKKSNEGKPE